MGFRSRGGERLEVPGRRLTQDPLARFVVVVVGEIGLSDHLPGSPCGPRTWIAYAHADAHACEDPAVAEPAIKGGPPRFDTAVGTMDSSGAMDGTSFVVRCILAGLVFLVGCASAPRRVAFLEDLALLEARVAQGRYGEALSRTAALEERAEGDPDFCPVLLARARALAGLGRHDDALATFRRVEGTCRTSPMVSARALFEVGVLVATRSPDASVSLPVFRRVITRFPDEPAARRAAVWVRDIVRAHGGGRAVVAEMRNLYKEAAAGEVAPHLLFQAAEALREAEQAGDGGARRERLALYAVLLRRHPDSHLADDAAVEAARVCIEDRRPWVAARLLTGVLARRETSWVIGSYETPVYPEAAWLMAEARFQATGDGVRAARDLMRFAREFSGDRRVAEALMRAYHLFAASGRHDDAREALRILAEVRPRTPAGREARRLLEEGR